MTLPAATMASVSLGKTVPPHVWPPTFPASGKPKVLIASMPAVTVGDIWIPVSCITPQPHIPPVSVIPPDTNVEICIQGSPKVLIANMPACRVGDPLLWGDFILQGCPKVLIGG